MKLLSRLHRGRHRVGISLSDLRAKLADEQSWVPPGWWLSDDGKFFITDMAKPNLAILNPKTITVDPSPCSHDNRKITYETEDFYSNGMFGVPASNMPTIVDMYEKITCTDCGKELFPNSETGVIVCDAKQGWHDTTAE
jgi:hypothetical protein